MWRIFCKWFFTLALLATALPAARAQSPEGDTQASNSEQVENSDEAYRRRMELEDARHRDPGYATQPGKGGKKLEKIDKLPKESRENIQDQLIDVIMENGQWEPKDAVKDYPYTPTAAANADPELKKQEQEAWDEQIRKYHEREAAAFGAHQGAAPGASGPAEAQGGGESGQGESGSGGKSGSAANSGGAAGQGSFQPYQSKHSSPEDSMSTAGVKESALDYLLRQQSPQAGSGSPPANPAPQGGGTGIPGQSSRQAENPPRQESGEPDSAEISEEKAQPEPGTPGLIRIEDLEKLKGTEPSDENEGDQTRG